jgi:hypothetical protein
MQRRTDVDPDDAQTVAQPVGSQPGVPGERPDDDRDAGPADAFGWDDDTGGLEVPPTTRPAARGTAPTTAATSRPPVAGAAVVAAARWPSSSRCWCSPAWSAASSSVARR